jgi:hypothetical protein
MSRFVHDRLQELEAEVRDLKLLPAADVRARGRRRGRRQLAVLTAAGAVVAITVGVAFARPHQQLPPAGDQPASNQSANNQSANNQSANNQSASGHPAIGCVLALPGSPAEVQIRVLDGGAPAGVLDATTSALRERGFKTLNGATGHRPAGAATVGYGPAAIGAATLVRAAVHGESTMSFDPARRDQAIDLTLGPSFTRLATATEMNQNLVAGGEPSAPPEC